MENMLPITPASKFNCRSSILAPGAILQDRYRIIRQLGKGGMGAVFEAVDQRLDATVALKETFSTDACLRRQFEQEARLLAQLHHPALPKVSDYFTEGDRAFLVMQFISGSDLAEIISQQPGPFPRNQVIAWADQLLDALIYLHTRDRQIIHRDIKPHNLKVTANGQISLLDFGLAKAQTPDLSGNSSQSIFGYTRRYSPIEQIQDQGTTPQSDIYALGATLYHLLTGVKPPDSLARAAALANSKPDPLQPANEVHRAVGSEIAAVLSRAMALSAVDRYPSANEFRGALRRVGRVGRSDLSDAKAADAESSTESATDTRVHVIARKPPVLPVDPFDSYSILKPRETDWPRSKPTRGRALMAIGLIFVLVAGFGTLFGFGQWVDSALPTLESAKAPAKNNSTGAIMVRQNNPESSRGRASGAGNASTGPSGETIRRADAQKRRTSHPDSSRTRPADAKPPHFSITP
jgi:serine/threonine protein kinase